MSFINFKIRMGKKEYYKKLLRINGARRKLQTL